MSNILLRLKVLADAFLQWQRKIYKGPKASFKIYWGAYGGFAALRDSPYLFLSLLIAIPITIFRGGTPPWSWSSTIIDALPNILGFSIGGYAILVGFGDREFIQALRGRGTDGKASPYMVINAAFIHFIVVQLVTLLYSILTKSIAVDEYYIFAYIGIALLLYAISTVLTTAHAILRFAEIFDRAAEEEREEEE